MPTRATAVGSAPSDDAIRTRAYLMWEADGRPDGRAEHYWGLASAELAPAAKPRRSAATRAPANPEVAEVAPTKAKAAASAKPKSTKPAKPRKS